MIEEYLPKIRARVARKGVYGPSVNREDIVSEATVKVLEALKDGRIVTDSELQAIVDECHRAICRPYYKEVGYGSIEALEVSKPKSARPRSQKIKSGNRGQNAFYQNLENKLRSNELATEEVARQILGHSPIKDHLTSIIQYQTASSIPDEAKSKIMQDIHDHVASRLRQYIDRNQKSTLYVFVHNLKNSFPLRISQSLKQFGPRE